MFFGLTFERSLPKLRVRDDEGVALVLESEIILPNRFSVVLERFGGGFVSNVVISSGTVAGDFEAGFDPVEVGKGFFIGLADEITADEDEIGSHGIDLLDREFEGFDVVFVSAHTELSIAHLDEGELLRGVLLGHFFSHSPVIDESKRGHQSGSGQ